MSINFDLGQVLGDLKGAVSGILGQDVQTWRGFSERQALAMVKQSRLIASGYASGELDDDDVDFFLDGLKEMARNFARTLQGLIAVTVEKVWNAAVSILQGAIKTALGGIGAHIPGL